MGSLPKGLSSLTIKKVMQPLFFKIKRNDITTD